MSVSDVLGAVMPQRDHEVQISLSTSAAPEELWTYWQDLCQVRKSFGEVMTAIREQADATEDETLRNHLWAEQDAAYKQWKVLDAWTQVIYAAYVFMTEGADIVTLEDGTPLPF